MYPLFSLFTLQFGATVVLLGYTCCFVVVVYFCIVSLLLQSGIVAVLVRRVCKNAEVTVSFALSVCPFAWNNSTPIFLASFFFAENLST